MTQSIDEEQSNVYEQRFKWQGVFEVMRVHYQVMVWWEDVTKGVEKAMHASIEKIVGIFEAGES
jgi:hypothetical protein